ncbi:hypothetical protein Q3G72_033690 [Acer saccharum]|nr:hypothetical protein Q3G72_033690 [Acer saccharum]
MFLAINNCFHLGAFTHYTKFQPIKITDPKVRQTAHVKDLTLALLLARPHPIYNDEAMLNKAMALTKDKYGSVQRVYIVCDQDNILQEDFQRWMIENNPTDDVKLISGSDHMTMFSKPKELCFYLKEIAEKYP